jgi:hypothetical protein
MRLQLSFVADLQSDRTGGAPAMNDWADYAVSRLRKQQQDRRIKDEKFLEKQRLKRAHGIPLWGQVREILKKNCAAFNTKMGEELLVLETTQEMELSVRSHVGGDLRRLRALFNSETGTVSWECGESNGTWELAVSDDGTAQFQSAMIPTTSDSMAKQMLDALLFG